MRVAIAVGHNAKSPGAESASGTHEFDWNSPLAENIKGVLIATGHEAAVFWRTPADSYRNEMRAHCERINQYAPDVAIELHFDALDKKHTGASALHWPESERGRSFAGILAEHVAAAIGIRNRGARPQSQSWSGATLYFMTWVKAPAVILESHFGDFKDDHDAATKARDSGTIADAVVNAINEWSARA